MNDATVWLFFYDSYLCFSRERQIQTTATMAPSKTAAPMAMRVTSITSILMSGKAGSEFEFRFVGRISLKL